MAEVNVSSYQPYKQPEGSFAAMGPLQVLQMIGQMQHNKMNDQTIRSREGVANAYKDYDPEANDIQGLQKNLTANAGYNAPEALRHATSVQAEAIANRQKQMDIARSAAATIAVSPNLKSSDISRRKTELAAQGLSPAIIQEVFSQMPRLDDARGLKEFGVKQAQLTQAPEKLLSGTAGPIGEGGVQPEITTGEAQARRLGLNPGKQNEASEQTGMQTRLPMGEEEQLKSGGPMRAAAQERATKFADEMLPIESAISALDRLGPNATAPGKEEINKIRSFVQGNLSWIPGADKIAGNVETTQDFDELAKYLKQIGGGIARNFGHGTDQAATLGLSASPNTGISTLANKDLLKVTAGLRRMEQARELDAQRQGIPAYKYPSWSAKWASNIDPRAFMVDKLDDAQWERIKKTLNTPDKRKKFNMSVKTAVDTGLIDPSVFDDSKK